MDNENNKEFKNNDSNIDDIETISFDNIIDDPIISNNQGSLSSFFNGGQDVQQDGNLEISNIETENIETQVNPTNEDTSSQTINDESSIEQQTEQPINTDFNDSQESHKTDNASSIIDDIKSANLQTSSKRNSKSKDDQPSGIGFIVILFIVLIIFIFALPYITKLF